MSQKEIIPFTDNFQEITDSKAPHYTYPNYIIFLAIQQRLYSFTSWRGIETNFRLWSQFIRIPTPKSSTIRIWFLKVALFLFQQPKEKRKDWIFLVDTILGEGQNKCLLILGISSQKWLETCDRFDQSNFQGNHLNSHDFQVLEIAILTSTKGEIINNIITNLVAQVGQPIQIISDHGSDIRKGIDLYVEAHPDTIYTYDFTHQVALWLKHQFSEDPVFQEFLDCTHSTRLQIQQTELAFLISPNLRSKARYHNIDLLVAWGLNILHYWEKQDFSLIKELYILDFNTIINLRNLIPLPLLLKLIKHLNFSTLNSEDFSQYLLNFTRIETEIETIISAANTGRRRFLSKFDWLFKFRDKLEYIARMLSIFALAKHHFNIYGLKNTSSEDWLNLTTTNYPSSGAEADAITKVSSYLSQYTNQIPSGICLPATTDIIESIFSKYKLWRKTAPFSEINETILSIVLATTKLTVDIVDSAMRAISVNDINNWIKSTFGQSMLSKRIQAFSNN